VKRNVEFPFLASLRDHLSVTDELMLLLHFIHEANLLAALDIIDRGHITKVVALPSARYYFEIQGRKNVTYISFGHYCSCPSFQFKKKEQLMCKHQLAACLTLALGNCAQRDIKDEEYADQVNQ